MAIYIDDRELIAAHQAGDTEAFDELVREHRSSLHNHARRKLYCDSAAEDAVQETLVRAYRALPKFDGEYRLGPWLHRIMSNVCIDEANRRKRDGEKTDLLAAQPSSRSNSPGIEEQLGLQVDDSLLQTALDELPESHREALTLRFVEELDYQQVAQVSGVSEQNARARVSRARTAMRAAMKGVASLPVVLLGLMKRGEKAAAAATSTGGVIAAGSSGVTTTLSAAVPAVTEASLAVAPTVVPVIAKAAVGIGLAAAVFTPTSDSAVHNAVEDLATSPAGIVVEYENEAALSAVSSSVAITSNDAVADYSPIETVSPEAVEAAETRVSSGSPQDDVSLATIPAFTEVAGRITIDQLVLSESGGGRYEMSGAIELAGGELQEFGVLQSTSWLRLLEEADRDGRRRIDALLLIEVNGSSSFELQLAGFAEGENEDLQIAGLFRADVYGAETASSGSFLGVMSLRGVAGSATLTLLP